MVQSHTKNLRDIVLSNKLIENLEFVHSRLKWLSKDRKIVLPHHKTFDLVDELMDKVSESIDIAKK